MAAISTQRLNELLQQVIEERNLANGWTTFDVPLQEFDPHHIVIECDVTVADVLEEGIPTLWQGDDWHPWGRTLMRNAPGGRLAPPAAGNPQPTYTHECYQCGRPITLKGLDHWTDHAGRSGCDLVLVEQSMLDSGSYWPDHQPKPYEGEEE